MSTPTIPSRVVAHTLAQLLKARAADMERRASQAPGRGGYDRSFARGGNAGGHRKRLVPPT